jgi:hypothetical protein
VDSQKSRTFLSVKQVTKIHSGISERTLRYWIFNARDRHSRRGRQLVLIRGNGFEQVMVRKGRKILIDEKALLDWLRGRVSIPRQSRGL